MSSLTSFQGTRNVISIPIEEASKRLPTESTNYVEIWGFDSKTPRVLSNKPNKNVIADRNDTEGRERVLKRIEEEMSWNLAGQDGLSNILFVVNVDNLTDDQSTRLARCIGNAEGTRIIFIVIV